MNILHLQLSGNPGGIVTLCRAISMNSSNKNHMFFLFDGGSVTDAIRADGGIVHIEYADHYRWRKSIINFKKYCKENKIDVIVNHSNSPIAISHVLAVKRILPEIKIIMYLHGAAENILSKGKKALVRKFFINKYVKKTDAIVAISEYVKNSAIKGLKIKPEKISVVYNGVDSKKFIPNLEKKSKDDITFIYVGRVIKEKGVHLLIKTISLMKHKNIKMIIVGDGEARKEIEELVNQLGLEKRVKILGKRMDISELLENSDWFVHPAICNEGFGITLIEAMSAAVPCIAFKKGGIPEIIKSNYNGFLLSEVSEQALADQLDKCCEIYGIDKYKSIQENAIKTGEKFDISNTVRELEKLYR